VAKKIRHIKSNVIFEVISEEKKFYIVIKNDEPDIKLRLEKFAVDGKMFKLENQKRRAKEKAAEVHA
jgi:hypothetical protein